MIGQTCSKRDNYKKLPVQAKEHEKKKESKNRPMYVASNTKLIFFLLVCLSLLLVVEIWSEMTAMVTIGVLGFFIIVMLKKSLFSLKSVRSQINTKRVIIFVAGFIVGFAYLYYQNNTNYV